MQVSSKCRPNGAAFVFAFSVQNSVPFSNRYKGYVRFKSGSPVTSKASRSKGKPLRFTGPPPGVAEKNVTAKASKSVVGDGIFPKISLTPKHPFPHNDLSSTRPAPLKRPSSPNPNDFNGTVPIGARLSYYWQLGKAYGVFYKTGLKNVWANYKEASLIRKRKQFFRGNAVAAALYGGQTIALQSMRWFRSPQLRRDIYIPEITRREFQLLLRSRLDNKKLVPFLLLFVIFGEWLPLIIVFLGSAVVPNTCRIPQQVRHDHHRHFRRFPKYAKVAKGIVDRYDLEGDGMYEYGDGVKLDYLPAFLFLESWRRGLQPLHTPPPIIGRTWLNLLVKPKLRQNIDEMLADMVLIRREGGFTRLEPIEIFEFAIKYHSEAAMEYLQTRYVRNDPIDPFSEQMKDVLVELLERHANLVLSLDFTKLTPEQRWLRVLAVNDSLV